MKSLKGPTVELILFSVTKQKFTHFYHRNHLTTIFRKPSKNLNFEEIIELIIKTISKN